MKLLGQYKFRNFLFLSLLVHLIAGQSSMVVLLNKTKPQIPIRVKLIQSKMKKKEELNLKQGEIIEAPRPKKIEKPITQTILADHDSRAHSNNNAILKNQYKSTKTVLPQSKSKPKPVIKKKKVPYKKEITTIKKVKVAKKKELNKKNKNKIILAKKEDRKKKSTQIAPPPITLKDLFTLQKDTKENQNKKKPSLFKGFDIEKFAKYNTQDGEESDTETVFLDSHEFKYASYFAKIKRQIEKVWSYPEQAAIKGLQGELLLQFVLDRTGKLLNISLINSSGYSILDDAALGAIKMASPFTPYSIAIQKKKLRIIASFTYKPSYTLYTNN